MKAHLYNARLGKVRWFIARFGWREVLMKPLRTAAAPWIIARLPKRRFEFRGNQLEYFYHRYNMTWASERCVEIPIALSYLESGQGGDVLEVGNVLSHYLPTRHEVLDKFEKGEGIINEDILTFAPGKKYDLIISISTFEHIGFDDEAEEPSAKKIKAAIAWCRGLLKPGGRLVLTLPVGYNLDLDGLMKTDELGALRESYLRRTGRLQWEQSAKAPALQCRYKTPFPYANAILIAEFASA